MEVDAHDRGWRNNKAKRRFRHTTTNTEPGPVERGRWRVRRASAAGRLPLYIMIGTPPQVSDASEYAEYLTTIGGLALATRIVDTVYVGGFIVFITGCGSSSAAEADDEWLATLAFARWPGEPMTNALHELEPSSRSASISGTSNRRRAPEHSRKAAGEESALLYVCPVWSV